MSDGARDARDEALRRVAMHSGHYFDLAMCVVISLPTGWTGTGEDLRLICLKSIGKPHHHNVFGALTNSAQRHGLLYDTGKIRQMQEEQSHARKTGVWMRTDFAFDPFEDPGAPVPQPLSQLPWWRRDRAGRSWWTNATKRRKPRK